MTPELRADEHEIKTYRAMHTQSGPAKGVLKYTWLGDVTQRGVGGHLVLTDQRVLFYPTTLERAGGGIDWECSLASISDVGRAPRGRNLADGSLRRRVRIECDGATEYFVVNFVANGLIDEIKKAAGTLTTPSDAPADDE